MSALSFVAGIILAVIAKSGYFGIFVLMTLESCLIPIPSEITMTFAGYLVSTGQLNFWLVVFAGTFANLIGSILCYYIGFALGETVLQSWIVKYGKFLLLELKDYKRASYLFNKYGESITFFSRLLPIVRTFISLPAGIAEMKLSRFIIFTLLGSFIWSTLLVYLGVVLGSNWASIDVYYRKFEYIITVLIVALVAYYIYRKLKKKS